MLLLCKAKVQIQFEKQLWQKPTRKMGVNYLKDISVDILLCGACTLWHYSEIVMALKVVFDFVKESPENSRNVMKDR